MEAVVVTDAFWRGKRVLVTGHTGFKGGWLALWLRYMRAEVAGYSLPAPTSPSLFESAGVAAQIESTIGDIRDAHALEAAFAKSQPEVVFHLAAQPLVRRSYAEPVHTYSTNVMGTVNVLEAARHTPSVRVMVVVTSDKCYESPGAAATHRESDAMGGHDPYSSSKGCAEIVTAAYRQSYLQSAGVAVATARAGNVIGGGDWAEDRLIPDFVRAALRQEPLVLRSPSAVRPWQHVLEALAGYLILAERLWQSPELSAAYNFGPDAGNIATVLDVVRALEREWAAPVTVKIQPDGDGLHESVFLALDSTRARMSLGWRPILGLEEAVRWTAAWYKEHRDSRDLRAFTVGQLARYAALASQHRAGAAAQSQG